ncbi:MAG TPA: MotA/TolQ/ExbB proton channel family protein [Thermoanaerobaculaceae bacterium]|nr:MotA/TolQ/ExbB proton channel family protein [Thermoanaerobaculaceae bacterium]
MSLNLLVLWGQMGGLAKGVALLLLAMSVYSLSVAGERLVAYARARRQSMRFSGEAERLLREGVADDVAACARSYSRSHLARVVSAGIAEYRRKAALPELPADVALESARHAAERAALVAAAEFRRGTGGLATIGATAPFVGLFGTVIGIINAFAQIARTQTTGIASVAAGIAEALVTTALGLLVALPAVWLHNHLIQRVEQFEVEMSNSCSALLDRLVEETPERRVPRLIGS